MASLPQLRLIDYFYVVQSGFEPFGSWVLGLHVCTTMPGWSLKIYLTDPFKKWIRILFWHVLEVLYLQFQINEFIKYVASKSKRANSK